MPGTKTLPVRRPHRAPHIGLASVVWRYVCANPVLTIAAALALLSCMVVPPDARYLNYIDFKTLTCLFCTLAVICALKNIRFFTIVAQKIVQTTGNMRTATIALVYITFIGSMLIANDMALLTFLPLGYFVLSAAKQERHMAFVFILQNLAANLGGMLTPFGNPQNLYLYSFFKIDNLEFMGIMAPCFVVAIILITVCCLVFIKPEKVLLQKQRVNLPPTKTVIYLILFIYSILIVFRSIPYWTGLIVIPLFLIFMDRDALKAVDYPLLLTFVFFFIFAGNMARIEVVRTAFSFLLSKSTLLFSVLSCQVISNVPSAVLLSQFTNNYADLLVGVNIGGAGTLIASLASLITFREYAKHNPTKFKHYILTFSLFNFGFLAVLTIFALVWNALF